jgi:signal transduction histidine kinase
MAALIDGQESWSLRRQFVIPLAVAILVVAVLVTWIALWAADSAYQRSVHERMQEVSQQIRAAKYPLTKNVVQQIRSYSGVDVVLFAPNRSIALTSLVGDEVDGLSVIAREGHRDRGRIAFQGREFDYVYFQRIDESMATEFPGMLMMVENNPQSRIWQVAVWAPAVSGLVSALAIVLVTTVIASRIVRRIERLETQVNRIAAGEYGVIEPSGPSDSIHRLSRSINSLSQQLEVAHDWISKTERARLISMIAGGMAHQLRNSLTGASLLLQSFLLSHQEEAPEEIVMAQNQLKLAAESVRRLLASDPNVELVDEPELTVEAIATSVADCVGPYAGHQGVVLQWSLVEADREIVVPQGAAVVGALINLIMNAIEAAGPQGTVACELQCQVPLPGVGNQDARECTLRWRIIDNGSGPPAGMASSIMEPFVSSKREGVGLGLPMAARVAQRCHGSLNWQRSDGHTVFEFMIRGRS